MFDVAANTGREWLEADGRGGFSSGTAALPRSRRYHALLLAATTPPSGRVVLVNGLEAWVESTAGRFPISSQAYGGGVVFPDGASRIESFEPDPWPSWTFRLRDGTLVEQEIFVERAHPRTVLAWRLREGDPSDVALTVRLLFSVRDYHALHHENADFRFEPRQEGKNLLWKPYEAMPIVTVSSNATYLHDPIWYRNFWYREENARGLDCSEDLASPGILRFALGADDAVLMLAAGSSPIESPVPFARRVRSAEKRRRVAVPSRLERSGQDYVVRRGEGRTVVAGYPWFTDWGRDTFLSLRGLCLATGRLDQARDILHAWSGVVSEGMLPNRFCDGGDSPEYNSVDASLWYIVAAHDYFAATENARRRVPVATRRQIGAAIDAILTGYSRGTRFGIRADADGLLAAGAPGVQLTWMDAKVGDWVVTPRIGKPVEVQALWINALRIGSRLSPRWEQPWRLASNSFAARFWNEEGFLSDVVDCDHVAGTVDASFRPNQIFAIGGLPFPVLEGERARRVVESVEQKLWTPMGLRSLAADDPAYVGRCEGSVVERDRAYHQGTVWPYLAGAFVEAWVRVRDGSFAARREAREKFLGPLLTHLDSAGIGHLSEIADGDFPHTPRGCPFQAWSVGEALRLDRVVLAER